MHHRPSGEVLTEAPTLKKQEKHDIAVVVDRLAVKESAKQRRTDSVKTALRLADGLVVLDFVDLPDDDPHRERCFSERMACPDGHPLTHRLPVTTPPEIIRKVEQAPS